MKNIFKTIFLLSLTFATFSCVNDDDFSIPPLNKVFFEEGFEGIDNANVGVNQPILLTGWSNVSLNGGSKLWEARAFSGRKYAQLSAFGSNETNMDTWLITPAINLDATKNEAFSFLYKAAFYTGNTISVLISENYDGSGTASAINSATWTDLPVSLPNYSTTGYPSNFSKSSLVNISSFNGNVHIAIRYKGSSSGINSTYQIDDIKLFENN